MKKRFTFLTLILLLVFSHSAKTENTKVIKMIISGISAGTYNSLEEDFFLTGRTHSLITEDVNSFDLHWCVNNSDFFSSSFTELGLYPYQPYIFYADQSWTPQASGVAHIKAWITNVNGDGEDVLGADTVYKTLEFHPNLMAKKALIETFSSINCGSCAVAAPIIRNLVIDNYENLTALYYHPSQTEGSPLTLYNSKHTKARADYYQVGGTPFAVVSNLYASSALHVTQEIINLELQKVSPVSLTGSFFLNAAESGSTVSLSSSIDINNPNYKLFIVLLEEHVEFEEPPGFNGEQEFYYVMRNFITDTEGYSLPPLKANEPWLVEVNFDSDPEKLVQEQLSVIAFVQNLENREILQAARLAKSSLNVEARLPEAKFSAYPNPANSTLMIRLQSPEQAHQINIYDLNGQRVYSAQNESFHYPINIENLGEGFYFVEILQSQARLTNKILITR